MNRRDFLQQTIATGAVTALSASSIPSSLHAAVRWPVGCFNRPWTNWTFDDALKQIKAAGYSTTGLLTRTKTEPFIGADATPEYLSNLKQRIAASGLAANMGALRSRHDIALEESIKETRKQVDNATDLGLTYLLTFGVDKPEEYEHYYKVMSDTAAYANERKLKLVMKPHGGSSGAADEIVAAMKIVNHTNFKIWYDAGNIIYYTGKDPIEELKPIAQVRDRFLRQGLRRREERRDDPVRHRQGGFRRRVQGPQRRRLRRTAHGRVLQDRRDAGRDDGQCTRQSGVPGKDSGEYVEQELRRPGDKEKRNPS